ncbi:MAG: dephospho-CoA kinase [Deltaproteobacteria bacterium]|nr:dephospho-CoA kinase [Deltaproteobacteria bacterium]
MRLIGLTGGISSGKSTVSQIFTSLGAHVIDADVLAREVVAKGTPGLDQIVGTFGRAVLAPDGTLDRKKLGDIIYHDETKRKELEAITHPLIFQRFGELTQAAEARGEPVVIYDAPLLIERGLHRMMHTVIVVWVPRDIQIERLMARDGIDRKAAELRLASQMPLDDKRAVADFVIDNSKTREHAKAQVEYVWREILRGQ